VIVAESPPVSGLYFYDAKGKSTEPLFSALMKQLAFSPGSKEDGLKEFQRRGWLLVDATYKPINKRSDAKRSMPISKRNEVINQDYDKLRSDLDSLISNRSTPLILLKANVCRTLQPRLVEDGFNVLNRERAVYFPSNSRQKEFHKQFGEIVKAVRI
jgi:hypothetical protein